LVKPVTLLEHFTAQEKRQTDGEQIPRISPGSMTHVPAAFLREAAIWRLGKIQQIFLIVKDFPWWAVEGSNL
jgi:hypothetical protein